MVDYGYSNYTVEGTTSDCLLHLNESLPDDNFYGEETALLFAEICPMYCAGDPVGVDVDQEDGNLWDYTEDEEIKALLRAYSELHNG